MERKGSFQSSQEPATSVYPDPDSSTPHLLTLLL